MYSSTDCHDYRGMSGLAVLLLGLISPPEKENGKTVYELESIVDGPTRDLMIDAAGKVYVVEEQLDVNQALAPVKTAMEARGQIVKLEVVTENGKKHYEGQVRNKAGKTVAVELDFHGKPIER